MEEIYFQLEFWKPVLSITSDDPQIEVRVLTGQDANNLQSAACAPCPAGNAYQINNGAIAQFQVTNLSPSEVYLYFLEISPYGRLEMGPLLGWDAPLRGFDPRILDPQRNVGLASAFLVNGLPGSVTETRIFASTEEIRDLASPPRIGSRALAYMDETALVHTQMLHLWHQIHEEPN